MNTNNHEFIKPQDYVSRNFTLRDVIKEGHNDIIYSVRFCEHIPSMSNFLATTGSSSISIYMVTGERTNEKLQLIHNFQDQRLKDKEKDSFYTCTWASSVKDFPVVAAGGLSGIIKVVNVITYESAALIGHGDYISELRTHTVDPGLIFSSSKDKSIRMWNVRSLTCVTIFGGEQGHRFEVVSIDINDKGNLLISGGQDAFIKIWNLEEESVIKAVINSDNRSKSFEIGNSDIEVQQYPLFSTDQVHWGYIDSVRWVGDFILSKSTTERAVLWAPDSLRYKSAVNIIQEYKLFDGDSWFVKFNVSIPLGLFAIGNNKGRVCLYSLSGDVYSKEFDERQVSLKHKNERFQFKTIGFPIASLSHTKSNSIVRETTFSPDGKSIVYCLDDGTIYLWSIEERVPSITQSSSQICSNNNNTIKEAEQPVVPVPTLYPQEVIDLIDDDDDDVSLESLHEDVITVERKST